MRTGRIPIQYAVREGCPLYGLCLHPLLRTLEDTIHDIHIGGTKQITPVLTYVDDVTILVTKPKDFDTILQSIHTYEKATGARLNIHKSKTLAIAKWTAPATALGIDFQEQITILGGQVCVYIRILNEGKLRLCC
jgi:hypothetical protein